MGIVNSVQNSKLYKKSLELAYEKGLQTKATNKALENMGSRIAAKTQKAMDFINTQSIGNVGKQTKNMAENTMKMLDKAANQSSKVIKGSPEQIKQVQQIAKNRAFNRSGIGMSNADEALKKYNSALLATKMKLGAETVGNMATDYFLGEDVLANPVMAATRAVLGGAAIGGTTAVGVTGYQLISGAGSYNNNYYDNLNNNNSGTTQNY